MSYHVCDIPAHDEFESTSGPSVSGMTCVISCPNLLIKRGSSAYKFKCQVHFTQHEIMTEPYLPNSISRSLYYQNYLFHAPFHLYSNTYFKLQ